MSDPGVGRPAGNGAGAGVGSSLWAASVERPELPALAGQLPADVVVVGGGVAGLMIAERLVRDGADVVLIEAGRLAGGVTANTTAKVTALHGAVYHRLAKGRGQEAAAAYAEANQTGVADVVAAVERRSIDCDLRRASAFTYASAPGAIGTIEAEVEAARAAGLAARLVTGLEVPFPLAGAVELADQAHLHPLRYCLGLAAALEPGRAFERTRVREVREEPGRVVVDADGGQVVADHAVIATQAPIVDPAQLMARAAPTRSYAISISMSPAVAASGGLPTDMYLSVDEPTRSLRPATGPDGPVLVVGGEGHRVGAVGDTTAPFAALEAWAGRWFPGAEVGHRWSAHDHVPVDGVPFIGRLSSRSRRRWVATGFAKWGFTTAAVAARIVADGIAGRANPWAPTFDSTRLASTLGRGLVTHGATVARALLGDRVETMACHRRAGAGDLDDLGRGAGMVVSRKGQPVAVHRTDGGELVAVSAVCSHQRCLVRFNTADRSWDCPCHGSRFDLNGRVIQGPASADLAPVELGPG